MKKLRTNTKPFFRYLKSKNKLRKTVSELTNSTGGRTKTPSETAETLLDFFQTVFKKESHGPLPKKCYESKKVLNKVMEKLVINAEKVKKKTTFKFI